MHRIINKITYPFVWLIAKFICWRLVSEVVDVPIANEEGEIISTFGKYPELVDDKEAQQLKKKWLYNPLMITPKLVLLWLAIFWSHTFLHQEQKPECSLCGKPLNGEQDPHQACVDYEKCLADRH